MPIKNDDALEFYIYHQEKGIVNIEEYLFLTGDENNDEIIIDFLITYHTQIQSRYIHAFSEN